MKMGGKLVFWIFAAASVSNFGNLIMLAGGHSFDNVTIAVSFVSNFLLYGVIAWGIYLGNKKSKEESE